MALNSLPQRLKINGLIDTGQTVVSNMERIARNATSWLSYDTANGQWAVVINKSGDTTASFDDSNIVGPISVTGRDITELYNKASIKYPLRDSADKTDTVELEIPDEERSEYETDKTLEITLDMVNEPVQAQLLGLIELKQSRVDTVIEFNADYSTINVAAGDIVDVTNSHLGWSDKLFRVVSVMEAEGDGGAILVKYQCLEYDPDVYDETALTRYLRTDRTNIKSIGVIGQPISPVVTAREIDSIPGQQVEMVIPSGIVEKIELWVSSDNSNYTLDSTITPGMTNQSTFETDYTFTQERPYFAIPRYWSEDEVLNEGSYTVYWKYRGVNSFNTGPFSSVTSTAWDPVFTAEGIFVSSKLITNTGNISGYDTGILHGIAESQRGETSKADYESATGISLTGITKDTGAPLEVQILVLQQSTINLATINSNLGNVAGTATLGNGFSAGSSFNDLLYYVSDTYTVNYNMQAFQAQWSMPFGTYSFQYYDSATSGNSVRTGNYGYVPTYIRLGFQPVDSEIAYEIKSILTSIDSPYALFNIMEADLTAAGVPAVGGKRSLAGQWQFQLSLFYNHTPAAFGRDPPGTRIFPYAWDVDVEAAFYPWGFFTFHQF